MIDEKYASDMHECHSIDSHNEVAFIQKSYFLATQDLVAAILLTQIYYWFSVSRHTKKVRASIERNGRLWIAKKREDWLDECCISPKQFDRGIKILEERGFVVCSIFRFGADAVKHISLNYDRIAEIKRNSPSGNSRLPDRDKTTRTETTTDNTPIPPEGDSVDPKKNSIEKIEDQIKTLYATYPRKINRGAAERAIRAALKKTDFETLLAATKEYRSATDLWPANDKQFIPHPSSWYNGRRWEDDRSEWHRGKKSAPIQLTQPDNWN